MPHGEVRDRAYVTSSELGGLAHLGLPLLTDAVDAIDALKLDHRVGKHVHEDHVVRRVQGEPRRR